MGNFPEIKNRFDAVAAGYNKRAEATRYMGPEHMLRMFEGQGTEIEKNQNLEVLDLGCGTGLCGQIFKSHIRYIDGVDLSEKMIDKAKELGIYRNFYINDIISHLHREKYQYDLVIVGSVFVYFGELQPALNSIAYALKPSGRLIFTFDRHEDQNSDIQVSPRNSLMFTHSQAYVKGCLDSAGYRLVGMEKIDERLSWQKLEPVPACAVLASYS